MFSLLAERTPMASPQTDLKARLCGQPHQSDANGVCCNQSWFQRQKHHHRTEQLCGTLNLSQIHVPLSSGTLGNMPEIKSKCQSKGMVKIHMQGLSLKP